MKQGSIYYVGLDPAEGREQKGHRPVLVVSADAFNTATRLPVIVPITTGGAFVRRVGFYVELQGTVTTGVIRCDQPRVLDLNARPSRFVEIIPIEIMDDVLAKIVTIFS